MNIATPAKTALSTVLLAVGLNAGSFAADLDELADEGARWIAGQQRATLADHARLARFDRRIS